MKPTDEERREVAAKLRGLDVSDLGDGRGIIDTPEEEGALFSRILEAANDYRPGLHYAMSHFAARAAVELFADLIEPQDRTCRMRYDTVHCDYVCSACGAWLAIDQYQAATADDEMVYRRFACCPNCGARVEGAER